MNDYIKKLYEHNSLNKHMQLKIPFPHLLELIGDNTYSIYVYIHFIHVFF